MKLKITESVYKTITEEQYFSPKLSNDVKRGSSTYKGDKVLWFGIPNQMIVVHKSQVYARADNIFYPDKLKYVENMIRNTDSYVELECGYGLGTIITFDDIFEQQRSYREGSFSTEYSTDSPASTGDDEIDEYIGEKYYIEDNYDVESDDLKQFIEEYEYSLTSTNKFNQAVQNIISSDGYIEADEDDQIMFDEFVEMQSNFIDAFENKEGDIGKFMVQVRDGNHRTFGSINAGEDWIAINLSKTQNKDDFKGYYKEV